MSVCIDCGKAITKGATRCRPCQRIYRAPYNRATYQAAPRGGTCYWCGEAATQKDHYPDKDHTTVMLDSCVGCNVRRGRRTTDQWAYPKP
jgi:hypothetical protein